MKLFLNYGKEKLDSVVVKVEGLDVGRYISIEVVVLENMVVVIILVLEIN